ncbi:predicted protein [Streptomyces viridosporus ATCC 14672]|uniref:Predicted protein n=1 Tax=Streptomyces viridosporus (strain ATCC 14672 / DSM 40746 / JCM 4963 / KCTC 9882 / NRRL B-12104 / FH 1290) TaxID=566461 RepID=D6AAS2_STRV1|nr:predicted protein [Streptomyces viridosporus ATCC 14672]
MITNCWGRSAEFSAMILAETSVDHPSEQARNSMGALLRAC